MKLDVAVLALGGDGGVDESHEGVRARRGLPALYAITGRAGERDFCGL
jgi:hypothetical protein